jgi:hypothetical protein
MLIRLQLSIMGILTNKGTVKVLTCFTWQVKTTEHIIYLGGLQLRLSPAFQANKICPVTHTDVCMCTRPYSTLSVNR